MCSWPHGLLSIFNWWFTRSWAPNFLIQPSAATPLLCRKSKTDAFGIFSLTHLPICYPLEFVCHVCAPRLYYLLTLFSQSSSAPFFCLSHGMRAMRAMLALRAIRSLSISMSAQRNALNQYFNDYL